MADALTFTRATIAGAGLAGLSAAVALRKAGIVVSIADSAAQAGGRCRSYHDPQLGLTIDNGNHLVLSGNPAVARFRSAVGATTPLAGPEHADFTFQDLTTAKRWTVRINDGALPWWIAAPARRVPGSRIADYLPLARLLSNREGRIDQRIATGGPAWSKLLEPVLLAALNTAPGESSTMLTANILRETIAKGGRAMRPRIAEPSLAAAFIDPALAWLDERGSAVALGRRLRTVAFEGDRVTGLDWGAGVEPVAADEAVILAVPPWVATSLVPDLQAPDDFRAIVNGHFALPAPAGAPAMLGLFGGTAEWLFAFPDRLSVTVSAAERLVDLDRETLARTFWADICAALAIDAPMPTWQIVKEKRATFAATPEQNAKRPSAATRWRNLFLAGDWTDTGLPATIEGALRSGETVARLALAR
ncbi:hydroxysqualene dehydroxylase HpnE [Sphingomonas sp. QA11]|uniref:hydroxysqualene dehydroxylase HpnE n=1 Tax=Sphingomonas sp. QA11 TaxID=2950605 RepID=UPI00234B29A0|nr:hydroxysqualene dehydroxylase HpnE [Sphingomonas sp. QA11]WCM25647.1 hydroxysqualene dehydroxylase HpnE [Sphingomonas sp. QA11]